NLPERHRSLRAVFSSSAQLLGDQGREAFQRLSVFRGGFDRQAAERVASASLPLLLDLVNKSLIAKAASSRFVMHEMLRQFASELLAENDPKNSAIRNRHSRYYLEFVAQRGEDLRGDRQQQALEAIHPEMGNIRSAWNWAVERRHWGRVDQSLESIYRFCLLTSRILEVGEIFSSALESLTKQEEPRLWARTVARQGRFFILLGRFEEARRLLEECLEVFRHLEEHHEIAFTLSNLGEICFHRGEFEQAREMSEESAGRFRALDDRIGTANAMNLRGRIAGARGDYEESRRLFNQSLVIYQDVGAQDGIARCLTNLGNLAIISQTYLEAIRMFQEGLEIYTRLGDRKGMAFCLNNLGVVFEESSQREKARDFQQRALALFREVGYQDATARSLENLGRITFSLGEYRKSGQYFSQALRTASAIQAVPTVLMALMGLARLLDQKGRKEKAWQLLQFITAHPKSDSEARVQARELIQSLQTSLPAEVREAVGAPRPEEDLEALAREVLADLNLGSVATLDTRSA
ncbi:MAG: tetratricopeptide repeat protein, partial [Acidobacteriota bacterium]